MESGIALLDAVGYPDERERYEDAALSAAPFGRCPQCGEPNKHLELGVVLIFNPGQQVFIQLPSSADDVIATQTRSLLSDNLDAGWTVDMTRDPAAFRSAAIGAVLSLIDQDRFIELRPSRRRDYSYHAALIMVTRPGLLSVKSSPDDLSEEQVLKMLEGARTLQLVHGFFEAFAEADVAVFDPITHVAELFPTECFEPRLIAELYSGIGTRADEGQEVAALRAALASAAVHGGVARPGGLELARDLVRLALSGTVFEQRPEIWARLLTADDVYRAIGAEAEPSDPQELERAFEIATTFGHGEEVAELVSARMRIDVEGDRLDDLIDGILVASEARGLDDESIGPIIAQALRLNDLDAAIDASLAAVDRFIDDRPLLVVAVVGKIAARLKNEGSAGRALALLDAVEPRFPFSELPAGARSILLNERANALRELQRLGEALHAYQEAIAVHPGTIEDADVRVALINEGRTLRDLGWLQRSQAAFARVVPFASGRERFECLFGMVIGYQREADYAAAEPLIHEAYDLLSSAPLDDQVARFVAVAELNSRALGTLEPATPLDLNALAEDSSVVTARQKLLTLGIASAYALRMSLSGELRDELLEPVLGLVRGLQLAERADSDPEFALTWLPVARLAGEDPLARRIVDALLTRELQPLMTMRAASIGAEMACEAESWDRAASLAERAIEAAVVVADLGSRDTNSFGVVETLGEVRALGAAISRGPDEPRHNALVSQLADTQCSLLLSLQFAQAGPNWDAGPPLGIQALQWLDAGELQLPMLTVGGATERRRGSPLSTEAARGVGERVSGRIARSPALATEDLVGGVGQYLEFRDEFRLAILSLDIDASRPLTVVPSAELVGIPLHHAMPDLDLAYSPSLGVAAALARRALAEVPTVSAVAEVRCTCFNDFDGVVEGLAWGGEALADHCDQSAATTYRSVEGVEATATAVEGLLSDADIIKLSCHGVSSTTTGRFALLLSDGDQLPPPMSEIAAQEDLAERYLFDWSDLTEGQGGCRLVVSSACTSGSGFATRAGEYIGLARGYLASGVLAFVAPLWPVAAAPAQEFANAFIVGCLASPGQPLATTLRRTRAEMAHLPRRVADAFVLHGHAGPIFK